MWTDYMYFVESIDAFNIKIHPSWFFRIHIHSSKRLGRVWFQTVQTCLERASVPGVRFPTPGDRMSCLWQASACEGSIRMMRSVARHHCVHLHYPSLSLSLSLLPAYRCCTGTYSYWQGSVHIVWTTTTVTTAAAEYNKLALV